MHICRVPSCTPFLSGICPSQITCLSFGVNGYLNWRSYSCVSKPLSCDELRHLTDWAWQTCWHQPGNMIRSLTMVLCSFWRGTFDPNLTGTNWNQFNGEWWGPLKIRYVHKPFEEGFTWIFRCSRFFALSMLKWVQHEDLCLTHFIPLPNFIWGNRVTPGLTAFPVITNFRLDPCRWWPMITSAGMGLSLRTGAGRRLGCWSIWFWCFCWVWPWRTLGFRFVFRLVFCFDADLELGC